MEGLEVFGAVIAALSIILIPILLIIIAFSIVTIIAQWKFFKKCGKNGWEALIPFYNTWTLLEISGLNWWYFLILLAPTIITILIGGNAINTLFSLAAFFVYFLIYYNIAKKTKQNEILFGILGIFVPYVAIMILGFSKNITYDNNIEVNPNGVF